MRPTRRIALAVVAALAATLTACGKTEEPPVALPSTTAMVTPSATHTPSPSTQPTGNPQQQALHAYLGMQRAYLKATEIADPSYPDLSRYATGAALRRLTAGLTSMRDQGLRGKGQAAYHPQVESLEPASAPTKARVRDCMDTRQTELYKADGGPYKDTPGGLRLVIADLERIDDAWRVTGLGVHEVGSCKL